MHHQQPKPVVKWIFKETLLEFPGFANVNFFGFKLKHIEDIVYKRLDSLPDDKVEELLKKLYKGLDTYFSR